MKKLWFYKEAYRFLFIVSLLLINKGCLSQIVKVPIVLGIPQIIENDTTSRWIVDEKKLNDRDIYFIDTSTNIFFKSKVYKDSVSIPLYFIDKKCIIILKYKCKYYPISEIILKYNFLNCDGWVFYINKMYDYWGNTKIHLSIRMKGTIFELGAILYHNNDDFNGYGKALIKKAKKHFTFFECGQSSVSNVNSKGQEKNSQW